MSFFESFLILNFLKFLKADVFKNFKNKISKIILTLAFFKYYLEIKNFKKFKTFKLLWCVVHLWSVRDTIVFKKITEIMTQIFEELTAPILKKGWWIERNILIPLPTCVQLRGEKIVNIQSYCCTLLRNFFKFFLK